MAQMETDFAIVKTTLTVASVLASVPANLTDSAKNLQHKGNPVEFGCH